MAKDLRLTLAMLESKALQSEEQCLAIIDDLRCRAATFKTFYFHCHDRMCRRHRRCAGADLCCLREGAPPITRNDKKRLKRDFRRAPTQC
jgi:hypothetical protein